MILVKSYKDDKQNHIGFCVKGHSGYGEYGKDIICAAVSALTCNAVNSIETFSRDKCEYWTDEDNGKMYFKLLTRKDPVSQTLLSSMLLGLAHIESTYGSEYIKILHKEV